MNQKINIIDYNFVPETLEWCRKHYVPPVKEHISCKDFGDCDGMDGSCHWCREMTPYQWYMCCDKTWIKSLLRFSPHNPEKTRKEASEFIEKYKQQLSI